MILEAMQWSILMILFGWCWTLHRHVVAITKANNSAYLLITDVVALLKDLNKVSQDLKRGNRS